MVIDWFCCLLSVRHANRWKYKLSQVEVFCNSISFPSANVAHISVSRNNIYNRLLSVQTTLLFFFFPSETYSLLKSSAGEKEEDVNMFIGINDNYYPVSVSSRVFSKGNSVIIDNPLPETASLTSSASRLIIVFDQPRTARFFSNLICDHLASGQEYLRIQKTHGWDPRYPFGYSYL